MKPTLEELDDIASDLAARITEHNLTSHRGGGDITLVGIPRGGVSAALLISRHLPCRLGSPDGPLATGLRVVVDDVLATGNTIKRYMGLGADLVVVLYSKKRVKKDAGIFVGKMADEWIQFPWEEPPESGPLDAVVRLIEYLGVDPSSPHVLETPRRVLAFYDELRTQRDGEYNPTTFISELDDLVVVRGIGVHSLCSHHMLPWFGEAHVGYIPNGHLIGVSKLARAVSKCSAGLTTQEDVAHQVAAAVAKMAGDGDAASAVVIEAVHTCMTMRGPRVAGAQMVASALTGRFKTDPALRSEFMTFVRRS